MINMPNSLEVLATNSFTEEERQLNASFLACFFGQILSQVDGDCRQGDADVE
jgi:hypothetical protein